MSVVRFPIEQRSFPSDVVGFKRRAIINHMMAEEPEQPEYMRFGRQLTKEAAEDVDAKIAVLDDLLRRRNVGKVL